MILTKDYSAGTSEIPQALAIVFGGVAAQGLRHAVDKTPDAVIEAASKHD